MITVKLSTSIRVVDRDIAELELRAPRLVDLLGLPRVDVDTVGWALLLGVKLVTNAPEKAILDLPIGDAMMLVSAVSEMVRPMMPAGFSTEASSAPAGGATPDLSLN